MKKLFFTIIFLCAALPAHAWDKQYTKTQEPCLAMLRESIEANATLNTKTFRGISELTRTRDGEGNISSVTFKLNFTSDITEQSDLTALESLIDASLGKKPHNKTVESIRRDIFTNADAARQTRLLSLIRNYPDFSVVIEQEDFALAHTILSIAVAAGDMTAEDKTYVEQYVPTSKYE